MEPCGKCIIENLPECKKRFLAGFLSVLLLVFCVMQNCSRLPVSAEETETLADSELYALSAVLMDGENGRILYEKAGDEIRANASTTKILTCILALENGMLSDTVTVSSYAAKMPDVQLNIVEGGGIPIRRFAVFPDAGKPQ